MRDAFVCALTEMARKDKRVVLISGDMGFSVFDDYRSEFNGRFFNMGVAEQNMIGVAAGLAIAGKKVFIYSIIPFVTFRCLEQIRNDLCYQDMGVVIVGVGSGLTYGPLGFSHHAIDDIGALHSIPNMTILSPSDPSEVEALVRSCMPYQHPVYLRLGKNKEERLGKVADGFTVGSVRKIREGRNVAFITHGNITAEALSAAEMLQADGVSAALYSMPTIKPLNIAELKKIFSSYDHIIVIEEHNKIGGLGMAAGLFAAETGTCRRFMCIGCRDEFIAEIGSSKYLRRSLGLDSAGIAEQVRRWLGEAEDG